MRIIQRPRALGCFPLLINNQCRHCLFNRSKEEDGEKSFQTRNKNKTIIHNVVRTPWGKREERKNTADQSGLWTQERSVDT